MGIFNEIINMKKSQKENINFINIIDYTLLIILNLAVEYPSNKTLIFRRRLLYRSIFDTSANIKEYLIKQKDIIHFSLYFYGPNNNTDFSFFRIFGKNYPSMKSKTQYKFIILVYTQHVGKNNLLQITARTSSHVKESQARYLEKNKFTLFNLRFTTVNKNNLIISINLSKNKPVQNEELDPQLTPEDRISIFYAELSER